MAWQAPAVPDYLDDLVDPEDLVDLVSYEDFAATAGAFIADAALFGDKVLLLGPAEAIGAWPALWPELVVIDPGPGAGWEPAAIGNLVSRETRTADGQGFRALRVLAQMDRMWPAAPAAGQVVRHELGLDAMIAGGRALMVCAYRAARFDAAVLHQAAGVHPQLLGTSDPVAPSFRMYSQGPDCWSVSGVVDSEGADAFAVALRELVDSSQVLRLRYEDLELLDAAGMRALAEAAASHPGRRIVISGATATVRRAWTLLGHDISSPQVEMEP